MQSDIAFGLLTAQTVPKLMGSTLIFGADSGHSGEDRLSAVDILDCSLSEEEVDVF